MKTRIGLLILALAIAGCGSSRKFGEGYYVLDGDASSVHYPVAIVRYKTIGDQKFHTAFVDQNAGGFNRGTSSSDEGSDEITTTIREVGASGPVSYGVGTPSGGGIKMQEVTAPDSHKEGRKVNREYTLRSASKDEALAKIRSLVKIRTPGQSFSSTQEEICQLAFDMTCAQVIAP